MEKDTHSPVLSFYKKVKEKIGDRKRVACIVLLLSIFILALSLRLLDIQNKPLISVSEGRADEARQMISSRMFYDKSVLPLDDLHIRFGGNILGIPIFIFDHPPLTMYLDALSMSIFGVSSFSFRLPSIIFGALLVLIIYKFGREAYTRRVGYLSAFIIAVSGFDIAYSRSARVDEALVFFLFAALLFLYMYVQKSRKRYIYLFGIFAGLSMLTKYTAAIGVFVCILFLSLLIRYRSLKVERRHVILSVLLAALLPILHILLAGLVYGPDVYGGLMRLLSKQGGPGGIRISTDPVGMYLFGTDFFMFFGLFTVFFGIAGALRSMKTRTNAEVLLLLWIAVWGSITLFLSDRSFRYFLPMMPAIVMFAAKFISDVAEWVGARTKVRLSQITAIALTLSIVISNVPAVTSEYQTASNPMEDIGRYIKSHSSQNETAGSEVEEYAQIQLFSQRSVIYNFKGDIYGGKTNISDFDFRENLVRFFADKNITFAVADTGDIHEDTEYRERFASSMLELFPLAKIVKVGRSAGDEILMYIFETEYAPNLRNPRDFYLIRGDVYSENGTAPTSYVTQKLELTPGDMWVTTLDLEDLIASREIIIVPDKWSIQPSYLLMEKLNALGYKAYIGARDGNYTNIFVGKPCSGCMEGLSPDYDFEKIARGHLGAVYYAGGNVVCSGVDGSATQETVNLLIKKLS
jgi:hypothetical protein